MQLGTMALVQAQILALCGGGASPSWGGSGEAPPPATLRRAFLARFLAARSTALASSSSVYSFSCSGDCERVQPSEDARVLCCDAPASPATQDECCAAHQTGYNRHAHCTGTTSKHDSMSAAEVWLLGK